MCFLHSLKPSASNVTTSLWSSSRDLNRSQNFFSSCRFSIYSKNKALIVMTDNPQTPTIKTKNRVEIGCQQVSASAYYQYCPFTRLKSDWGENKGCINQRSFSDFVYETNKTNDKIPTGLIRLPWSDCASRAWVFPSYRISMTHPVA